MISKYKKEYKDYYIPFINSDYVCCDKTLLFDIDPMIKDICTSIIYMVEDNQVDVFKRISRHNITTAERVVFTSLFDKNIDDYLDNSIMSGTFRCIYLPDEDFTFKLIKVPSYNKTTDNVNHLGTMLLGKGVTEDNNELLGAIIEVITYFLHFKLKRAGVPMNRVSEYTNDIIFLSDYPTISDAQFLINYYRYIFKNVANILSVTYADYRLIYDAIRLVYSDFYTHDLKEVYDYVINQNHDIDDYKELLLKVYSDLNK